MYSNYKHEEQDFSDIVLNWQLSELKKSLLKRDDKKRRVDLGDSVNLYYRHFLPLILEDARATIYAGIEKSNRKQSSKFTITLAKEIRLPRDKATPCVFIAKGMIPRGIEHSTSMNVLLLSNQRAKINILSLASEQLEKGNQLKIRTIIWPGRFHEYPESFDSDAQWRAVYLGSLVTHQRMFEACRQGTDTALIQNIAKGELLPISKYSIPSQHSCCGSHFDDIEDKGSFVEDLSRLGLNGDALGVLNSSQRQAVEHFLQLGEGLQLLQGPPGTGKTTTIIALLKALDNKKTRVLVTAPSNKAVQVLAERFLKESPESAMILAGVEKRVPPHLKPIFLHSILDRLQQLFDNIACCTDAIVNFQPKPEQNIQQIKKYLGQKLEGLLKHVTVYNELLIKYSFGNAITYSMYSSYNYNRQSLQHIDKAVIQSVNQFIDNLHDDQAKLIGNNAQAYGYYCHNQSQKDLSIDEIYEYQKQYFLEQFQNLKNEVSREQTSLARLKGNKEQFEKQLLDNANFIFATLSVCGRLSMLQMEKIDMLIIDEAAQAVEPETLIAFRHKPDKVLLVGDTKQLPATVISIDAEREHYDWSMMWRLIEECGQQAFRLETQYRMHIDICQWPSRQYYQGCLQTQVERQSIDQLYPNTILCPYAFYAINAWELMKVHSFENEREAHYIAHIISKIKQVSGDQFTVGVITFYLAQVNCIEGKLRQNRIFNKDIQVSTVDGFQGDERDIIIVSFVRSNQKSAIGFLKDFRRLNVAITRAKQCLIMLGNATTLRCARQDISLLLQDAKERNFIHNQNDLEKILFPKQKKKNSSKKISRRKGKEHSSTQKIIVQTIDRKNSRQEEETYSDKHITVNGYIQQQSSKNTTKKITTVSKRKHERNKCRFFNGKPDSCKNGDACLFRHVIPKIRA